MWWGITNSISVGIVEVTVQITRQHLSEVNNGTIPARAGESVIMISSASLKNLWYIK